MKGLLHWHARKCEGITSFLKELFPKIRTYLAKMAHAGASINEAPLVVSSDEAAFVFDAEAVDVVSLVTFPRSP